MSLTLVSRKPGKPASRVRIGGEFDRGGRRGFVLLASSPSPCLLTRGAARAVSRALIHFAERVRPAPRPTTKEGDTSMDTKRRRTRTRKAGTAPRKARKAKRVHSFRELFNELVSRGALPNTEEAYQALVEKMVNAYLGSLETKAGPDGAA